jgi:XRE family transcriptional regulator of biofilm formation
MQETVGEYIARIRKHQGYSQTRLARIAGISRTYLSMIENGKATNPSLQIVVSLSSALGIDIATLIDKYPTRSTYVTTFHRFAISR